MKKVGYEKMKSLLKKSSAIATIYGELLKLEREGKKGTEIFSRNIDYLDICIKCEDEQYQNLSNLTLMEINERITKFIDERTIPNLVQDTDMLALYRTNAKVLYTLKRRLVNESLDCCADYDYYTNFLIKLDKYITDIQYNKFHKDLLLAKYNCVFINPTIEKEYIDNEFDNPYLSSVSSKIYYIYKHCPTEAISQVCSYYSYYFSEHFLKERTTYSIEENEYAKEIKAILESCFFMSEIDLENKKDFIHFVKCK